jgi:DNA-binding transcriptional LysR family regulator
MPGPGTPTLDQLTVLTAVADEGGLAAAARRLKRATSAVSYAIDTLEAQLGLKLFDRVTTRRPRLTPEGEAVLADARALLARMDDLKARVRGLNEGLEAEVALAVDVMLPTARLVDALTAFRDAFPTVTLRLHVEALGGVTQRVAGGKAVIGINNPMHDAIAGLETVPAGAVAMLPVAAPGHPLARKDHREKASDHIQLVLTDRSPLTEGKDFAVLGNSTWRLADLSTKHALLLAGLGWGNMPEFMVRDDIAAGRLAVLRLRESATGPYALQAVWRRASPPGPAGRWLVARFTAQG